MSEQKRYLGTDSAARKRMPVTAGVLDYFPDAIAAVAEVSWLGNEKHNPGEKMHHARGKSMDHADCIGRHLMERGGFDSITLNGVTYKMRHSASLAWRALALLQEELELELGLSLPRAAKLVEESVAQSTLQTIQELHEKIAAARAANPAVIVEPGPTSAHPMQQLQSLADRVKPSSQPTELRYAQQSFGVLPDDEGGGP